MPCPQNIQIVQVMNAKIFIKRRSAKPFIDNRGIELIKKIQSWVKICTKCGQCELRCPYNLPIRNTMAANAEYLESFLS
jgi:CO dehydrogenase/acetyl-CoA synthase alpha subunit